MGAPVESVVRRVHALRALRLQNRSPWTVILKAIDHQEVNEFLPPFSVDIEIGLSRQRPEVDLGNGCGSGHI
jgi:hypothetical protein